MAIEYHTMTSTLNQRVKELLISQQIPFKCLEHDAIQNCTHAAELRGTPLAMGGKSLIFKSSRGFSMFVLSAARQINSNRVRKILQQQKVRFANDAELFQLTSTVRGAVPPFGGRLFECELFIDETILANKELVFSCGSLTESLIMQVSDYLSVVNGLRVNCAKPLNNLD
jgi:prolyl-tRNA editing enzyme YbaK/EbsC (Cys-tRNA(Pro) deacylase)